MWIPVRSLAPTRTSTDEFEFEQRWPRAARRVQIAGRNMIRKNELSFVGGPAEWVIAKQREDARRVATAQRRKGYTSGWYPNAAVATEAMLRAPRTDAVPLSVEAVEWVLSEQPGQRMSVSALNDVFQTHTKAERERLASLVAEVCTVVRLPDERGSGAGRRNASCDLVMLKGRG